MPSAEQRREELKAVYREASVCTRCPQLASTRQTVVFGAGNADADLMFVGEAPGRERGQAGPPVRRPGGQTARQLLGEIGLSRGDVFIANVLKCRPPGNRDPLPQEIDTCQDYLFRQLELIEPRVICTLGNFSTKLLRGDPTGISRLHGRDGGRTCSATAPCGSTRSTTRPPRSTRRRCWRRCAPISRACRTCSRSTRRPSPSRRSR